jgi:LisH domain-containing protein ARMC9
MQTIMIEQNTIKWLLPLLSRTDLLSDYTLGKLYYHAARGQYVRCTCSLEYGVALLMNLCLRSDGRKQCAEIADQAVTVLSALLTHPNQEVRVQQNDINVITHAPRL